MAEGTAVEAIDIVKQFGQGDQGQRGAVQPDGGVDRHAADADAEEV